MKYIYIYIYMCVCGLPALHALPEWSSARGGPFGRCSTRAVPCRRAVPAPFKSSSP